MLVTVTEETPSSGFRRLSREIAKIDDEVGQRPLNVGLPNAATIGEVCDALRSIKYRHETYLVIDNCQYLDDVLPPMTCRREQTTHERRISGVRPERRPTNAHG